MREKFGDNEDAPTNATILIEAYQKLADACRKAGVEEEADKYEQRIELLKKKIKKL